MYGAKGNAEAKNEIILTVLEELGDIPESLQEKVMKENDLDKLKSWFKIAIKVKSINEFVEAIK